MGKDAGRKVGYAAAGLAAAGLVSGCVALNKQPVQYNPQGASVGYVNDSKSTLIVDPAGAADGIELKAGEAFTKITGRSIDSVVKDLGDKGTVYRDENGNAVAEVYGRSTDVRITKSGDDYTVKKFDPLAGTGGNGGGDGGAGGPGGSGSDGGGI